MPDKTYPARAGLAAPPPGVRCPLSPLSHSARRLSSPCRVGACAPLATVRGPRSAFLYLGNRILLPSASCHGGRTVWLLLAGRKCTAAWRVAARLSLSILPSSHLGLASNVQSHGTVPPALSCSSQTPPHRPFLSLQWACFVVVLALARSPRQSLSPPRSAPSLFPCLFQSPAPPTSLYPTPAMHDGLHRPRHYCRSRRTRTSGRGLA